MEIVVQRSNSITCSPTTRPSSIDQEEADQLRRGPWTVDEDLTLINYIADHGEGRWNSLARAAGLKRTGKSCRLRWLNYLRPDLKRGTFTAEEQLLVLDLHSRWGNRWSKIAQHLPGRTDNEIKNYWRTKVQKHAKQLNCDINSKKFKDAMRYIWMPRLIERIQASINDEYDNDVSSTVSRLTMTTCMENSSSDSFPSESYGEDHCVKMHADGMINGGDLIQGPDQGLWFEPTQASQFQDQELDGWVQGFSEGLYENLWSLDDICPNVL